MKKKKNENKIFDSIRKQTAPPSILMKNKKKAKKSDKVGRKQKHKGNED